MKKERKKLIKYITYKIDDCIIQDRVMILNMIVEKCGIDNIYEENTGVRILYKHISDHLLVNIKEFIEESIKKTALNLDSVSDEDKSD